MIRQDLNVRPTPFAGESGHPVFERRWIEQSGRKERVVGGE